MNGKSYLPLVARGCNPLHVDPIYLGLGWLNDDGGGRGAGVPSRRWEAAVPSEGW
jgi:hypothetical protein